MRPTGNEKLCGLCFFVFRLSLLNQNICEKNAGNDIRKRCHKCSGQCIAAFGNFCSHKIDGHGVENGFGAAGQKRSHKPDPGIAAVLFEDVQCQTGGGGGGKHADKGKWYEGSGKAERICNFTNKTAQHFQKAGTAEYAYGYHKTHQGGQNFHHGFQAVGSTGDKGFVDIYFLDEAVEDDVEDDHRNADL